MLQDLTATAQEVVQVVDLTKTFDGGATYALDKVSLSVPQGELCVLIGLSGSGKSTLLRHLNGLHQPTSGAVRVLGTDPATAGRRELRALRRQVGFVFQSFNLVGRLTALENVCQGALGRLRGPRLGLPSYPAAVRRDALTQLERVGLGDRAFQRADTLSGGQQQRVSIARMLLQRPQLVLADEPVAALDPEASATVMDLLLRVCREDQLTVVCSLHQVELALSWADRVAGLRDGRLVFDEPTAELRTEDLMTVYQRVGATE